MIITSGGVFLIFFIGFFLGYIAYLVSWCVAQFIAYAYDYVKAKLNDESGEKQE